MSMQFTRNYDLLNLYSSGAYYWDATKSVANNWRLRETSGSYQSGASFYYANGIAPFENILRNRNGSLEAPYMTVGTNGTAFSYEDYHISEFTVTEYSDTAITYSVANDNSSITVTMYKTFLNSSGSEQTVREVGLVTVAQVGSSSYNLQAYLIAREVLATPIVVPANGYFKVPVTFTVNVPQNLIPHAE